MSFDLTPASPYFGRKPDIRCEKRPYNPPVKKRKNNFAALKGETFKTEPLTPGVTPKTPCLLPQTPEAVLPSTPKTPSIGPQTPENRALNQLEPLPPPLKPLDQKGGVSKKSRFPRLQLATKPGPKEASALLAAIMQNEIPPTPTTSQNPFRQLW